MTESLWQCDRPIPQTCRCGNAPGLWHMACGDLAVVVCETCRIASRMVRADDPVNATTMARARREACDDWAKLMATLHDC